MAGRLFRAIPCSAISLRQRTRALLASRQHFDNAIALDGIGGWFCGTSAYRPRLLSMKMALSRLSDGWFAVASGRDRSWRAAPHWRHGVASWAAKTAARARWHPLATLSSC
jgi:hypothetical protein